MHTDTQHTDEQELAPELLWGIRTGKIKSGLSLRLVVIDWWKMYLFFSVGSGVINVMEKQVL